MQNKGIDNSDPLFRFYTKPFTFYTKFPRVKFGIAEKAFRIISRGHRI